MNWNDSDHCTNQDILRNCHQRRERQEGVESSVEAVALGFNPAETMKSSCLPCPQFNSTNLFTAVFPVVIR